MWYTLRELVRVLSLSPRDGVFLIHFDSTSPSIEYLCLNPSTVLNRMLDQCHKILLTSGTLEPAGDFSLIEGQRHKFTCGHVVSDENFQALCVGQFLF